MPKKPKFRVNYGPDGQYLLRLVHALEHDGRRPVWWRKQTMALAQALANKLLEYGEISEADPNEEDPETQGEATGEEDQTPATQTPATQTPEAEIGQTPEAQTPDQTPEAQEETGHQGGIPGTPEA